MSAIAHGNTSQVRRADFKRLGHGAAAFGIPAMADGAMGLEQRRSLDAFFPLRRFRFLFGKENAYGKQHAQHETSGDRSLHRFLLSTFN
jgi:hypothetical protein